MMLKIAIVLLFGFLSSLSGQDRNARLGLKDRFDKCPDNVQRIADQHPDLLEALRKHPALIMDCLQTIAVLDEQSGNMKRKKL
jgi:hypothetical protein